MAFLLKECWGNREHHMSRDREPVHTRTCVCVWTYAHTCMCVSEPVHTCACMCLNLCTHGHVCVWTHAHMCMCVSSGLSLFLHNHQDSTMESLPSWLCLNHFPSNPPLHSTVRPMFRPPNILWSPQWGLSINIWTLGKGQHILKPYSSHSSLYGLKLLSLEGNSGGQTTEGLRPVRSPLL